MQKKIGLDIAGSFSQFLFFSNYIQVINTQIWKIVRIFHKSCTQMFPWYIALFVSALLLKNCMHFWKTIQNIYISTKCSMKIKQPILKLLRVLTFFPQKLAYSFFKSCKWVFLIKLNSYFGFFYLFWFSNKNRFEQIKTNSKFREIKSKNRTGLFGRILINWGLAKINLWLKRIVMSSFW